MPKIAIKPENAQKIEDLLQSANGKATAHTFTKFEQIQQMALAAESQLEQLELPQSRRQGAIFKAESGGSVANSYRQARKTTLVVLYRGAQGWFLKHAQDSSLWPNECGWTMMYLTAEQDAYKIKKMREQYAILAPKKEPAPAAAA